MLTPKLKLVCRLAQSGTSCSLTKGWPLGFIRMKQVRGSRYSLLARIYLTPFYFLSLSLGGAEAPLGFYSPSPHNFPAQLVKQVGCQLMAPLSEWLCVLAGDVFSSSQKLVIYHYARWPWEWFQQTAPAYRLGAQRKQHAAGETRVMMTITSQGMW